MTTAFSDVRFIPLTRADEPFLWEMLYLALYVPEGGSPFQREILAEPDIACYVRGWGRAGDWGLQARDEDAPVGAVWLREWSRREQGYGFVRYDIPELTIALLPAYRNRGLGSRMIRAVIAMARDHYPGISLSVVESSPARRLYERLGFRTVGRVGDSQVMLLDWSQDG